MTNALAPLVLPPMNRADEPITWPTRKPDSLSEDARTFHRATLSAHKLDRDFFAPRAERRFVPRKDAEKYEPTARDLATIAELEEAGLLRYSPEYHSMHAVRTHSQYTVAFGRGSQLIRVWLLHSEYRDSEALLAVLVGGDLEPTGSRSTADLEELTVRVRHEDATDFEHDASSTAMLRLLNPTPAKFDGYGRVTLYGLLVEACLYELGADPLTQEDPDTQSGTCDRCDEPHPFAPYLPPSVDEFAQRLTMVRVEGLPIRPYLVRG